MLNGCDGVGRDYQLKPNNIHDNGKPLVKRLNDIVGCLYNEANMIWYSIQESRHYLNQSVYPQKTPHVDSVVPHFIIGGNMIFYNMIYCNIIL